jgi:hypothetical protein
MRHPYSIPTGGALRFDDDASTIFEAISEFASLLPSLQRAETGRIARDATDATPHWQWLHGRGGQVDDTYTIFEGTSEIQRLVIARSISGVHVR